MTLQVSLFLQDCAFFMPKKNSTYSHVKITEKEKKQPEIELTHKHPERLTGNLNFYNSDGKQLKILYSAKTDLVSEITESDWIAKKCDVFKIVSGLYCAVWKNNPNRGFFFISGNKKSVQFDQIDLKHAPNRILTVLKYRKKRKNGVLNTT